MGGIGAWFLRENRIHVSVSMAGKPGVGKKYWAVRSFNQKIRWGAAEEFPRGKDKSVKESVKRGETGPAKGEQESFQKKKKTRTSYVGKKGESQAGPGLRKKMVREKSKIG